jgi:hypothetical protein
MIMARLACRECGSTDDLLSVKIVRKGYPVDAEDHPSAPAGVALVHKIDTPAVLWDDAPEPTGMIHCNNCGEDQPRGDLVEPPPV